MAKRGKIPSLISASNGKPSITEAKRKRRCKRCDSDIIMGEKLFEIPNANAGFRDKKSFCKCCFREILDQTKKDVNKLESLLNQL